MKYENGTFEATIAELRALTEYASTDQTRQHIACVCFDTGLGRAVATDGHRLLKIDAAQSTAPRPNETKSRDEYLVNARKLQAALKGKGSKKTKLRVTPQKDARGNGAHSFMVESDEARTVLDATDATFPPCDQVIPDIASMAKPCEKVGFNAFYLAALGVIGEIAVSHGCKTSGCWLRLGAELDPARIDATFMGGDVDDQGSATIVVMPMRV